MYELSKPVTESRFSSDVVNPSVVLDELTIAYPSLREPAITSEQQQAKARDRLYKRGEELISLAHTAYFADKGAKAQPLDQNTVENLWNFSEIANSFDIVDPRNLQIVIDTLTRSDVQEGTEQSTFLQLAAATGRGILYFRSINEQEIVEDLVKKIIPLHQKKFRHEQEPELDYERSERLLDLLALSGQEEAKKYIESLDWTIPASEQERLHGLLRQAPSQLPIMYQPRPINNLPNLPATIEQDWENKPAQQTASSLFPQPSSEVLEKTRPTIEALLASAEATAQPLLRLHVYNLLKNNPDISPPRIAQEIHKMQKWNDKEHSARTASPELPTIGLEVECPAYQFDQSLISILDDCGVHHDSWLYDNTYDQAQGYFEINPTFTYSAALQNRLLMEITKLGAIPLQRKDVMGEPSRWIVPANDMTSLHINLGIPSEVRSMQDRENFTVEFTQFMDIFTFAYCSPQRLYKRKTPGQYHIEYKDTRPSEKVVVDSSNRAERLELRTFEFRDTPTFRLVQDVQDMGAALFSSLKYQKNSLLSENDFALVELYENFSLLADTLRNQYGISPNLADSDRYKAIELIQTTDVQDKCRKLIQQFAGKARKILRPLDNDLDS